MLYYHTDILYHTVVHSTQKYRGRFWRPFWNPWRTFWILQCRRWASALFTAMLVFSYQTEFFLWICTHLFLADSSYFSLRRITFYHLHYKAMVCATSNNIKGVAGVCKQTNNNFKEYSVCVIHILSCRRAILCITQMLYFIALNLGIGIGIHLLRSAF